MALQVYVCFLSWRISFISCIVYIFLWYILTLFSPAVIMWLGTYITFHKRDIPVTKFHHHYFVVVSFKQWLSCIVSSLNYILIFFEMLQSSLTPLLLPSPSSHVFHVSFLSPSPLPLSFFLFISPWIRRLKIKNCA